MTPAIQRLQDLLDQELQNAIVSDRPVDYRQVFLDQLNQAALSDSDWIALSLSLLLAADRNTCSSERSGTVALPLSQDTDYGLSLKRAAELLRKTNPLRQH